MLNQLSQFCCIKQNIFQCLKFYPCILARSFLFVANLNFSWLLYSIILLSCSSTKFLLFINAISMSLKFWVLWCCLNVPNKVSDVRYVVILYSCCTSILEIASFHTFKNLFRTCNTTDSTYHFTLAYICRSLFATKEALWDVCSMEYRNVCDIFSSLWQY